MAGSAGVTPAYADLESALILPIDPPRCLHDTAGGLALRDSAQRVVTRAPSGDRCSNRNPSGIYARGLTRPLSASTAMVATPMASGSWMWRGPNAA